MTLTMMVARWPHADCSDGIGDDDVDGGVEMASDGDAKDGCSSVGDGGCDSVVVRDVGGWVGGSS